MKNYNRNNRSDWRSWSFIALISLLCFSSCSEEFEPEIDEPDVLVINVLAQPDSLVWASVSHSWVFNDSNNWQSVIVGDAIAECSVNDGEWLPMTFDEEKERYIASYRPVSGDRIRVRAHSDKYGDAEGMTEIPVAVPIDSWSYTIECHVDNNSFIIDGEGTYYHPMMARVRYKIVFTDPADGDTYYLVNGNYGSDSFGSWELDDPIISENESNIDGVFNKYHYATFFSDNTIKGQTYTLSLYTEHTINSYGVDYGRYTTDSLALFTISRDYYLYLLSLSKKYNGLQGSLEEFGMADPRNVFCNVSPGKGIVASCAPSVIVNDLYDELMQIYSDNYE